MLICILYALVPLGRIVGAICGYDLVLCDYPIFIVSLTVLSVIATVLLLFLKISLGKVQIVFSALLPSLSAVNGLFLVLDSPWRATIFFALICFGCSIIILVQVAHHFALKTISVVFSVFLILLLLFSPLMNYIFGDLGLKTTVKSASSPQHTYTAKIIDSNQGALGGNTIVNVWNNRKVTDLFICKFLKSPVSVYTGNWGESDNMQISWENEHTLIINSREYVIDG